MMVMKGAFCTMLAVAAVLSAPAAHAAATVLETGGLGRVRLGMTVAAAERALGTRLAPLDGSRSEPCWIGRRADSASPGVGYMVEGGRVVRIDIFGAGSTRTRTGIGIGSTRDDVVRRYGPGVAFAPHPLAGHASWAVLERSSGGGIRAELVNGKVASLWAGRGRALDYPEACS